jgi:hypothetical protein
MLHHPGRDAKGEMQRGHSSLSAYDSRLQRRRSRQAGNGRVPKVPRDDFPQLPLLNDFMTKQIRLSADTKESRQPHPSAGGSVSLSEPKTGQEADYRSVTYTPQRSCGSCPPGHSLKKWPGGDELLTGRGVVSVASPPGSASPPPPRAKWCYRMVKACVSLGEFDPSCQLSLAGGGGRALRKKLESRVLLALRQFPRLARRGMHTAYVVCVCVCVKLAGAAQSISQNLQGDFLFDRKRRTRTLAYA